MPALDIATDDVIVYRIGIDTPDYTADDLTGIGAERHPGRWNEQGFRVIYTASSRALACLETLVHTAPSGAFPFNRYLVEYAIPRAVWDARARMSLSDPGIVGWDAIPAGRVSKSWGSAWLASQRSVIAEVPSVLVPEESNVLINPRHPDLAALSVRKVRRWVYDPRFWAR